jgi:hypothetical protein
MGAGTVLGAHEVLEVVSRKHFAAPAGRLFAK